MPDATEYLVEWIDRDSEARYDHIADRDHAIESLRGLVVRGISATLYQRVPFEVQIGVTVKSPRRRRKKEAKEDAGAASPQAAESKAELAGQDRLTAATAGNGIALPSPASPVSPWTCEARFDGDPECLGQVWPDPATHGHFCEFHLMQVPASHRTEMHRLHGTRNRPVRVAHAG